MLIDTHCHLTDERLAPEAEEIIASMSADGLEKLITVGYDRESSFGGLAIARAHDNVYCTVGIHPHEASSATAELYGEFAAAAADAKTVGIGEIGLDYYYDLSPRDVQRRVFAEQIELAYSCRLPVCLHVRDAYEDCRRILEENKSRLAYGVLLHCYSGSAEMVKVFSRYDAYFAFGGAITFKNARHNLEALAAVPYDRLLLETDCPYMTPAPYRGRTNYPRYVALVAGKTAETTGRTAEEIAETTSRNAKTLFGKMK